MEKLTAIVESIVYRNEENGYTVLELSCGDELMTAVGTMGELFEGMVVEVEGEWSSHPSYGKQLKITSLRAGRPSSAEGIARYLCSGIIPGVGPVTAQRIVNEFGEKTLDIIRDEPGRLAEVKGISMKKAMDIAAGVAEHFSMQEAMLFLETIGVSPGYAAKIYKKYGDLTQRIVSENPYTLVDDIEGIGFKTADRIARSMGMDMNSTARAKAGLIHIMKESAAQNGHTCLPCVLLEEYGEKLLGSKDKLEKALTKLCTDGRLVMEDVDGELMVWLPWYKSAEETVASRLLTLSAELPEIPWLKPADMISMVSRKIGAQLAKEQNDAVLSALRHGVCVLTGGPGTGKTTTIKVMIGVFEAAGLSVVLAAPTGRAAKRMTQATGYEAKTLHRLLEYTVSAQDDGSFKRDETNPLEAEVIIIDEMSMVDIQLMLRLLRAVAPGSRLVLVGDSDQLPSVGAGNVLKDIVASGLIPVVRLQQIFRQAEESLIVVNAHRVNQGEMPILKRKDSDFFFEHKYTAEEALQSTLGLVKERLPRFGNYDALRDIQVLCPMKKGDLGVIRLNIALQQTFNPPLPDKREVKNGDTLFREGDKVMQVKNNYNLAWVRVNERGEEEEGEGIFNGDIGFIQRIDNAGRMLTVAFDDGRFADYEFSSLDDLQIAYAVSIHKSQGSEFPVVVLPLVSGPPMLLSRNLLYTAITRARNLVVITGREECVKKMVENNAVIQRYSGLGRAFKLARLETER